MLIPKLYNFRVNINVNTKNLPKLNVPWASAIDRFLDKLSFAFVADGDFLAGTSFFTASSITGVVSLTFPTFVSVSCWISIGSSSLSGFTEEEEVLWAAGLEKNEAMDAFDAGVLMAEF